MPASRLITPAKSQARAETLAGHFPALLLSAERIAASVAAGVHGRRRAGPGEQFWQFKRYQAGDPASKIDWRASARSQHALIREREWEAAQTAFLWLDRSASLDWASSPKLSRKSERAELLLLSLADLLLRGGERVGLLGSPTPPLSGRGLLGRLAIQLQQLPAGPALPPLRTYPRNARIVLFGDFLDPIPELAQRFKTIFAQGLQGHLVQILDPAEESLPYSGRIDFNGLEGEGRFLAPRAEKLRDAYLAKLAEHRAELTSMVGRLGWTISRHRTDKRPELALMNIHTALSDAC